MVTEHYLSFFQAVVICRLNAINDSGLFVRWSGLKPFKRAAIIWKLLCSTWQCWNSLLLSTLCFQSHTCLSFCITRITDLKHFLGPDTPLKVRNTSASILVFVFTNGLIIVLDVSWSFAAFCNYCLLKTKRSYYAIQIPVSHFGVTLSK